MPIQFHDDNNKYAYTGRRADNQWLHLISQKAVVPGAVAADIGCGGGVYSVALAELGAGEVTGIDFSEAILEGARKQCAAYGQIRLAQGTASHTGLPDQYADIVLERALIHHLTKEQLADAMKEAARVLKPGGTLIVQDRTQEDCLLPGSREHVRGCLFELFPKLIPLETGRRHSSEDVRQAMSEAGFEMIDELCLWEVRKRYDTFDDYRQELLQRTGRSILHELTDGELRELAEGITSRLGLRPDEPLEEHDRWTLWFAVNQSTVPG